MNYTELIFYEPRIVGVLDALKPVPDDSDLYPCYESTKRKLSGLVGFGASVPEIATSEAYECAIQELTRRLNI